MPFEFAATAQALIMASEVITSLLAQRREIRSDAELISWASQAGQALAKAGAPTETREEFERIIRGPGSAEVRLKKAAALLDEVATEAVDTVKDPSGRRNEGTEAGTSLIDSRPTAVVTHGDRYTTASASREAAKGRRVFIVHGHDAGRKNELARVLAALVGVQPLILHEQANGGRVLLEKLEDSAEQVAYAVVLLTADDQGRAKGAAVDQPRGRQNVVYELGYFMGLLGRARVAVLYESGIELPSDLAGLVYIPLDPNGAWRTLLARELEDASLPVDWSQLRHF